MAIGRPSLYSDDDILKAGEAVEKSGREVTGYELNRVLGGGNLGSLMRRYETLKGVQESVSDVVDVPSAVSTAVADLGVNLSAQLTALLSSTYATLRTAANARVDEVESSSAGRLARSARETEDACERLEQEAARSTALADAVEKMSAEMQQLRLQLSQQAGTLAEAKRSEETVAAHLAMCRENVLDLERESASSRAKLEQSQKTVKDLEQRNQELSAQLADAHARRESAQQDAAAKTAVLERLQQTEKQLASEVSKLNTEVGQKAAELAQLVHDKTALIERGTQQKERHAQALEKVNAELKAKDAELSELRAEIKLLKEQHDKKPKNS